MEILTDKELESIWAGHGHGHGGHHVGGHCGGGGHHFGGYYGGGYPLGGYYGGPWCEPYGPYPGGAFIIIS